MVYSASLNVQVKGALAKQAIQSNLAKISSNLLLDPDTTTMDTVILGPADVKSEPKRQQLQQAINNKHPDICVIYIYTKPAEADFIDCEYKKQVKKIDKTTVKKTFEEFIGAATIRSGRQAVSSSDFETPESDSIGDVPIRKSPFARQRKNKPPVQIEEEEPIKEQPVEEETPPEEPPVDDFSDLLDDEPTIEEQTFEEDTSNQEQEPLPNFDDIFPSPVMPQEPIDTDKTVHFPLGAQPSALPPVPPASKIEDYLAQISTFEDFEIFKEKLTHSALIKNMLAENSEYLGLVNMLDVLDQQIATVWRDTSLSATQKFERIKEIGLQRSSIRATTNSLNIEKAISIISTIVLAAKRTVDDKLSSVDSALYKITTDKEMIADTAYINEAIAERTKVQMDLLFAMKQIVDLYVSIDNFVVQEISELNQQLPSANEFINKMVAPGCAAVFTPLNTKVLADKIMQALQENRMVASQLEEQLATVIDTLFSLCAKDEEIIQYYQQKVEMLKAHRVEDIVIVDTLLKNCLRIFVGSDNTGRSSTSITWSGVLARRQNTLLLDLTGRPKFKDYGIDAIPLAEFMTTRIEMPFCCVYAETKPSPEYVQSIIEQLKSRLNYYHGVNVIVAPEDTNTLDQLSKEAICVHYITNCSTSSMEEMRRVVENHTTTNVARKLIIIDTPVSPLMIAENVGVDATIVQLVPIPNIQALRACALRHDRPYEYEDIVKIYEEAIR